MPASPQPSESGRQVVACLGSSSTAGRGQAFDWMGELRRRMAGERIEFRNFGVGGDLAWDALQRTTQVAASRPFKVLVWIGGNDVLGLVSPKMRWFLLATKHPPQAPSPTWFEENLLAIVRRLKAQTAADIGLCSLGPIGEDPDSSDPFQAQVNRRVAEYSAIIARTAAAEGCGYIPVYERLAAKIAASPGRAFTAFDFLPFYRDAFLALVLRQSPDEIGRRNGWRFHADGVHLNRRAGLIVADLVQAFIVGDQAG